MFAISKIFTQISQTFPFNIFKKNNTGFFTGTNDVMKEYYETSKKAVKSLKSSIPSRNNQSLEWGSNWLNSLLNIEGIEEFNKKNHNNIILIPIKIMESEKSVGGTIIAKMFMRKPDGSIEREGEEVFIKNTIPDLNKIVTQIMNKQPLTNDSLEANHKLQLEFLTEDIFQKMGVQTLEHSRIVIQP
jgi:hypothetical protein